MWGKTNDSKAPLSSPEPPTPPAPSVAPRATPAPPAEPGQTKTLLGRGLAVKGELSGREDVTIDGKFEGQIRVAGASVTIGANGSVTAEVEADEIFVEGRFDGSLRTSKRLIIRHSGRVTGNIETPRLLVEDGANICARVEMARPGESPTSARSIGTATPRADRAAVQRLAEASETVS